MGDFYVGKNYAKLPLFFYSNLSLYFRTMIGYDEILIEISMDKVSIYKYKK